MRRLAIGLLSASLFTAGCNAILGVQEMTYSPDDAGSDASVGPDADAGPPTPPVDAGLDSTTLDASDAAPPGDDASETGPGEAGQSCDGGTCDAGCAPGQVGCNGATNAPWTCVGGVETPSPACSNATCNAVTGTCEGTCAPGQTGCSTSTNAPWTCVSGVQTAQTSCTASSQTCAAGACGGACAPAQTGCNATTNTPWTCVNGVQTPGTTCAASTCSAGACVGNCSAGQKGCFATTNTPWTCVGGTQTAGTACTNQTCNPATGACAGNCSSGQTGCDAAKNAPWTCVGGTQTDQTACSSQTCSGGACIGSCAPGAVGCDANTNTPWKCVNGGPTAQTSCGTTGTCSATTGTCVGVCESGATQCVSSATLETCTSAGQWGTPPTTCDPHATCTTKGPTSAACICNSGYSGTGTTCTATKPAVLTVSPPSFTFAAATINTNGGSQKFNVTNGGSVSTPTLATNVSGPSSSELAITADTCSGQAVVAGGLCSVTVQFNPLTYGAKTASLDITGAGGVSASAGLAGTGRDSVALTVAKTGTGTGTVTGDQINCGPTCTENVTRTTAVPVVTLNAAPSSNSHFVGWSGGGCSGTGPCAVTMSAAQTVTANFALDQYALTLNTTFFGPAAATVASSPAGISTAKAGVATATYNAGQSVTLTISNPTTLWRWGGACSGTATTCVVTMSAPQTVNLIVNANNYVFVTSTTYAGNLGGQTGADALCQSRAQTAGLPGKYQAWLSTSTSNAGPRLAATGANGWIRVDGLPFSSTTSDLTTNYRVYYPPTITELGTVYTSVAFTGTTAGGAAVAGETCTDWTVTTGYGLGGFANYGSGEWTDTEGYGCTGPFALYCFGTDINRPLTVPAASGRRAFITKGGFNTGSGLAGADALCQGEATSAGLSNATNFLAFLPTATASAASRFDLGGANWNRTDNIPIATSVANLMVGTLVSAITVHADGTTYTPGSYPITGAASPTTAGTTALTCSNWSINTTAGGPPQYGISASTDYGFFGFSTNPSIPCSTGTFPIYCFDQ